MREIKFRAWGGIGFGGMLNNKMLYFELTDLDLNFILSDDDGKGGISEGGGFDIKKNTPVMQYIGLKDKNGREIYEGDILAWHELFHGNEISAVEWSNQEACFIPPNGCNMHDTEVIGNIHENKELLK